MLLWNPVVNKILFKLNNKGAKVAAYADDVVLLVKGKFLATICDPMDSPLGTLSEWAKENSLGIKMKKCGFCTSVEFDRNQSLFELNGKCTKEVAYADDVVVLIKGKFLATIRYLMKLTRAILLEGFI